MGGKSTGSKGRKGRTLTQHPSSSQLPNGSWDPPTPAPPQKSPELRRHGTGHHPSRLGCCGGWQGGPPRQTVPPYPWGRFSVSAGLSRQEHTGMLHSQTCGGSDKLVLSREALCGFGPILFSFCYVTLLQSSSTAEPTTLGVPLSVKGWLP